MPAHPYVQAFLSSAPNPPISLGDQIRRVRKDAEQIGAEVCKSLEILRATIKRGQQWPDGFFPDPA